MDRDREVAHATAHCPCLRLHGQQGHRQGTAAWEHADGQESAKPKADDAETRPLRDAVRQARVAAGLPQRKREISGVYIGTSGKQNVACPEMPILSFAESWPNCMTKFCCRCQDIVVVLFFRRKRTIIGLLNRRLALRIEGDIRKLTFGI